MRPRLTAQDLARLYDENPTPQMKAVLWEIARLRSVIKRAHTVRVSVGDSPPKNVSPTVWGAFCDEVDQEPCLSDTPTPRQQQRAAEYVKRTKSKD